MGLPVLLLIGQVVFVVLFAVFVDLDYNVGPASTSNSTTYHVEEGFDLEKYYPSESALKL